MHIHHSLSYFRHLSQNKYCRYDVHGFMQLPSYLHSTYSSAFGWDSENYKWCLLAGCTLLNISTLPRECLPFAGNTPDVGAPRYCAQLRVVRRWRRKRRRRETHRPRMLGAAPASKRCASPAAARFRRAQAPTKLLVSSYRYAVGCFPATRGVLRAGDPQYSCWLRSARADSVPMTSVRRTATFSRPAKADWTPSWVFTVKGWRPGSSLSFCSCLYPNVLFPPRAKCCQT